MNKNFIKTWENFTTKSKEDTIREIILNSREWDDFTKAVKLQYGSIIPLYHATTHEISEIIDREGFKLVVGNNRISWAKEDILYFQLGKSDYVSDIRPVLYRYDVPLEFLNNCDIDMDNVSLDIDEILKYVNVDGVDEWEEIPSDVREFIEYFIWNDFKLEGFELIATDRFTDDLENLFKVGKVTKVKS